jgi:tetratricopeptide (TPR) repeat protein
VATLNAVGATYDRLGRFDLAGNYFQRALSIEPKSVQTLNNIGFSYMLQGRLDDAAEYLKRAYARNQGDEVITANLGALGKLEEADQERVVAKAKAPSNFLPLARIERVTEKIQALILSVDSVPEVEEKAFPLKGMKKFLGRSRVVVASWTADGKPVPGRAKALSRTVIKRGFVHVVKVNAGLYRAALGAGRIDGAGMAAGRIDGAGLKGLRIEVTNGAGRNKMAARMRSYMDTRGVRVRWLTNAERFDKKKSVIFHRKGFRKEAEALANVLPISIDIVATKGQRADIRLRLGADLLEFDRAIERILRETSDYATAAAPIFWT